MRRREMMGVIGAGAAGVLAAGGTALGQQPDQFTYKSQLNRDHVRCLDACTACAAVCNEASHHCLSQLQRGSEGRQHHSEAHSLTMDCAAMCALSAELVARQSPFMAEQCNACTEACRRCADSCEKEQGQAEIMKECTRICRECEKACREMARAMGKAVGGTR
jgi:hypothetical protein